MRAHTYRHARKDYPAGVIAVYDNGGKTCDRYTVIYEPLSLSGGPLDGEIIFPYVGMSGEPFHPQGFCQHGEAVGRRPTGGWGGTCGKVIRFEDLPLACQKVVEQDLEV